MNAPEPKISALVITFNEENHIERYINDLKFADEIIVVDSFSSDKTKSICKKYDVKFYERKFDDFSTQRNYAITLATNEWITFFDTDEVVSKELRNEILTTVKKPNANAFFIKRNHNFMGKHLKYSGWQNDRSIRLFKNNGFKYKGIVHESLDLPDKNKIPFLKNKINHLTFTNLAHYENKLHHYAQLRALELFEKGKKPNLFHFWIKPLYRFIHAYIIQFGILDGKEGFLNCKIHAYGVYLRFIKLKELWKKKI